MKTWKLPGGIPLVQEPKPLGPGTIFRGDDGEKVLLTDTGNCYAIATGDEVRVKCEGSPYVTKSNYFHHYCVEDWEIVTAV